MLPVPGSGFVHTPDGTCGLLELTLSHHVLSVRDCPLCQGFLT